MQPAPDVRPARAEDAPGIAAVHIASWRAAYRGLVPSAVFGERDLEARTRQWEGILSAIPPRGTSTTLVATADGGVTGFASFGAARRFPPPEPSASGEVYAISADPAAWGTGTGAALLAAAERGLARLGHPDALLWVLRGNARARRFYERRGWTEDGGERAHESPELRVPAVRYRRALSGA